MDDRDLKTLFINAQNEVDLNWRGHHYLYNQIINKPRSTLKSARKVSLVWVGGIMIAVAVVIGGVNFLVPFTNTLQNNDYVSLDDYQNLYQVTSNNDSEEVGYNESSEENNHLLSYYEIL